MNNDKGLIYGKRIIVIGGAGLLGSKICENVIKERGQCIIADISRNSAEKVAFEISAKTGISPEIIEVSICDKQSIDKMINYSVNLLGDIDAVVNTSYPKNKNYGRKFENVTYEDFCENVNLHLGGYFLAAQRVLEYFKKKGQGNLINISSVYGVIPPRFNVYEGTAMTMPVEYAAVKAAIIHLTKYMAKYYAGNNIRVNCVSLGGLYDKQPQSFIKSYNEYCIDKGMLDSSDVVGTVIFLLSDISRYINGQNIIVDDGFTL